MIRRWLTLAAALMLIGAPTPTLAQNLDAILSAAMRGTATPAMAMLVMRDGKVAGEAVRGVRRNDGSDLARIDDVWLIGSDAKAMTATLIARLVDRGVLSWDAPLARMMPDLAAGMRADYRSVTLLELLAHRSGLPHDVLDEKVIETMMADPAPPSLSRQRLSYVSRALQDAPAAKPGATFSYSNTGFLLAAVIAERATGKSYEDLMRREIFEPLVMTSVGFGATHAGQPIGHTGGKPISKPADSNPLFFAPAGNINLSLRDWARFCLDQLAGAKGRGRLLKAETYRRMQTAQLGGEVGLGWGIQDTLGGRPGPVLTHAGSDGNWYAEVALFPKTDAGVLVAANAGEDMGGKTAATAALKAAIADLGPAP